MTVSELISAWTEEERRQHKELILECLQRERFLNGLKGRMKASEEELDRNLDRLSSGLADLTQNVNAVAEPLKDLYLRLARARGNA